MKEFWVKFDYVKGIPESIRIFSDELTAKRFCESTKDGKVVTVVLREQV